MPGYCSTPLDFASMHGRADVAKLLIESGAEVDLADMYQRTPLRKAAFTGRYDVVKLLLEHGANVNARDEEGKTPLAVVHPSDVQIRDLLMEYGGTQ
jgi:tankyrase